MGKRPNLFKVFNDKSMGVGREGITSAKMRRRSLWSWAVSLAAIHMIVLPIGSTSMLFPILTLYLFFCASLSACT